VRPLPASSLSVILGLSHMGSAGDHRGQSFHDFAADAQFRKAFLLPRFDFSLVPGGPEKLPHLARTFFQVSTHSFAATRNRLPSQNSALSSRRGRPKIHAHNCFGDDT
jgi:hypothetical protein